MEIKMTSTKPMYTVTITEHERFMLSCALSHAQRFEKMMGYGKDWCAEMQALQDVLDVYEGDDED